MRLQMKVDNTPTVTRRTRPISRKLRLRLETAKLLKRMNQRTKTVRQKMKKESKINAREPDPEEHVDVARVPRIKKNKLADPSKATSKYKRRQVNKTWLPTHLWHTKRAHMTRPTEPLWRMAIPLRPTEKTYRPAHRAGGSRGCLAWDASFVSTVACMGTDYTLENMLTLLGFSCEGNAARHKKWKAGTRHAHGWLHHIDNDKAPIVPVTVVWIVKRSIEEHQAIPSTSDANAKEKRKVKLDRRLFIRVHPSAFQQFWLELLKAAKMQKPQVLVEDLRFEIGSIEISGPGATEALLGVLKPRHSPSEESLEHIWTSLVGLSNPASLPDCSLLAFDIIDPRLNQARKQTDASGAYTCTDKLNELIVCWPVDRLQATPTISSHRSRWIASSTLPSQKALNRRKTEAGKGHPIAVLDKDPAIPVMLIANRPLCSSGNAQGSWTVLLPWCCTDVVWRSLMHYPLSSGGTPRFGGLSQTRQIAFERHAAWYPGDFPGTEAGKAWERSEAESRFDDWMRRPLSRRLAWHLVELGLGRRGEVGRGWACDWEHLLMESEKQDESQKHITHAERAQDANPEPVPPERTQKAKKTGKQNPDTKPEPERRRNTSSPESDAEPESPVEALEQYVQFSQLTPSEALAILKRPLSSTLPVIPTLITVRIRLLAKGTPKPSARIYRIPLPHQNCPIPSSCCGRSNTGFD